MLRPEPVVKSIKGSFDFVYTDLRECNFCKFLDFDFPKSVPEKMVQKEIMQVVFSDGFLGFLFDIPIFIRWE